MGGLTVTGLAESLLDIGNNEKTGALRIGADGRLRLAFFESGVLVYLVSDVPEENLVASFTRAGRFERAHERLELFQLEKQVTRKKTLVTLVLEGGLRDPEVVRSWLVEYAYEVFGRVFDARDVSMKFMTGIRADHPLPYGIPVGEVILEAVRGMRDEDVIHEALGPTAWIAQPVENPPVWVQSLPLSFYEGLVAARMSAPISIDELVAVSGIAEADALRAILGLRLVGAIAPFTEPKKLSDSGMLRMRESPIETGFAVDAETAVAALGLGAAVGHEDAAGDGPITMGEFEIAAPAFVPPTLPRGSSAPLQYPPPRPRGDTSRLRLLASAYIQMGEAEAAAGNYAAAIQCFESALAQKPNDLAVMLAYAKVHAKRPGGLTAAETMLEQACEAHPKSAAPRIALARLYNATGRIDDEEFILMEARRLEPANNEVRSMLDHLGKKSGGGAGLLSRFGFRSEAKPKPVAPSAPSPPRPAAPYRPPPPPPTAPGEEPRLICRYCRRVVQGEARICRNCGATL